MLLTTPLLVASLSLAAPAQDRDEAWAEDLFFLYEQIQEMHPDPFRGTPQEDFEERLDDIYGRIPDLTDDQMVVELMRLVALIASDGRDGHSGVFPRDFRRLPVRFYRFADGWYVIDAQDEELVGLRLAALDKTPVEVACTRLRPLLNHDNDTDLLARYGNLLGMPQVTHALQMTGAPDRTTLRLETSEGESREVVLEGLTGAEYFAWAGGPRPPVLPPIEGALWLSDGATTWWTKVLPEERALYVRYSAVGTTGPGGQSIGDFGAEIVRIFEEQELERVVVDARLNGGGDNTTFPPLIAALAANERLNQRGRLYALIGRHTFSAAGNFVTVFERDLNSILVGEPTGGGPNQYGDARNITLPHHPELNVRLSTRYHEFDPDHQDRLTHEPELPARLTAADYFAGRDPVLQTALQHR